MVSREHVLQVVKQAMRDTIEEFEGLSDADIDPSKSMADLGANSLDIVEVVSTAMRQLKVKVPRSELRNLENIDQLVDLLYKVATEGGSASESA